MLYTLSKLDKERWETIKSTIKGATKDSLYPVYKDMETTIMESFGIGDDGSITFPYETMNTFRMLWENICMYRAYRLGELANHEVARRFSLAGIYHAYDAGLIPLKDISNTQIIEAIALKNTCDNESMRALAVAMSTDRGNHVQDNLDDAYDILDNNLTGEWKYCLAFINNKDCDWIRRVYRNGTDSTIMTKIKYRNIVLQLEHTIDDISIWDTAIDNIMDNLCGVINGHVIYSPNEVYDEIRDIAGSENSIDDYGYSPKERMYVLKRLYMVNESITASHGEDSVITSRKDIADSLHKLYSYPAEYIAEEIMMNACDVWSH
jgi:hypothetical protein